MDSFETNVSIFPVCSYQSFNVGEFQELMCKIDNSYMETHEFHWHNKVFSYLIPHFLQPQFQLPVI